MQGTCGGGGSRRRFLRSAAAAGTALASADSVLGAIVQDAAVPTVTLGKTGMKVTKLGMGTSWALSPSFVQRAIASGIRYIDTSESYENTLAEKVIGQVLERTNARKDVYLVTKNSKGKVGGPSALKTFERRLGESLERLRTDYVDAYYLHGVEGKELALLRDPDVKAAFEALKKSGKIRFAGLSCHDAMLPEILTTAAQVGWIDQVMIKFNFRDVGGRDRSDDLNRALEAAQKANLGLVAMKTQGGAGNFPDKMADLQDKGFKKEVAAIKTVWMDGRMQVVVSEMTTFSDLRENVAASRDELTTKEARLLEEHRRRTEHLYCHGCGQLCETAARGVPVSTVLRYLRYYSVYGKRQEARALYQALPDAARCLAAADLEAAERACPYRLPVASLLRTAGQQLG
jgi:predicted aldo/keto reductase-like oxidoreductase